MKAKTLLYGNVSLAGWKKRKKIANIAWTVGRGLLTAGVFALGFYLLWRYDYIRQFAAVDNFVGMLPIFLVIVKSEAKRS